MEQIGRGAEAILILDKDVVVKERICKGYRIEELDKRIRSQRTKREANLISKARRCGINVPKIWDLEKFKIECQQDEKLGITRKLCQEQIDPKFTILMEYIDGDRIKDMLNDMPKSTRMIVYKLIGEAVAKLHEADIMHGDLTTSNMILKFSDKLDKTLRDTAHNSYNKSYRTSKDKLFIIDFGLGKTSKRNEDKAVDLYLLYEAFKSTHFKILDEAWENVLNTYKQNYSKSNVIINQLKKIEKRRRYKGE